jgi:NADPH:quinone reductase-like Zn-dependent oxidoreductase/acyl carrier protein
LAEELLAGDKETQVLLRGAHRWVARFGRLGRPASRVTHRALGAGSCRLESERPGVLSSLRLRSMARPKPGRGEVVIEVQAASVNFSDVMKALGIYPTLDGQAQPIGGECAGRVMEVGPGVEDMQVGEAVMGLAPYSFGTHAKTQASLVRKVPRGLSMEQAASVPIAYTTAWYGLYEVGRLRRGERVLIHAASGGTGMAAVRLAQRVGAQVYATAGSEWKRQVLREMGVEHVMDSRTLEFADEIKRLTAGVGVDVVLNSLSGRGLDRSLEVLSAGGRFVELGKTDIYGSRPLDMGVFRRHVTVSAVDMAAMAQEHPEQLGELLEQVSEALQTGSLPPLPVESYSLVQVVEAFERMRRAQHVGKIVVRVQGDTQAPVQAGPGGPWCRWDGYCLVSGGLGALGLSLSEWLVGVGCRRLVLVGRSSPSAEASARVAALRTQGVEVQLERLDIADGAQVAAMRTRIGGPLRGIFHLAAVLDDGVMSKQDIGRFHKVMRPKQDGAWNLHQLGGAGEVDAFVLYSSAASLLGSPGQGNYAAANAFLDGLAQYRQSLGLPALSINWGPFTEVGLAAVQANRGERLVSRGMGGITTEQSHEVLADLLTRSAPQLGVFPFVARQMIDFFPHVANIPMLSHLLTKEPHDTVAAESRALRQTLERAAPQDRTALLEQFVCQEMARILRMDAARIDRKSPLQTLGLDSLMAIELRNRLEGGVGLRLPTSTLWTYPDVSALCAVLIGKMSFASPTKQAAAAEPAPAVALGEEELLNRVSAELEALEALTP